MVKFEKIFFNFHLSDCKSTNIFYHLYRNLP